MVQWIGRRRLSPIGVDIGSRSVKLLQLSADRGRLWEVARWDLPDPTDQSPEQRDAQIVEALEHARQGRRFRGRDAVFCFGVPGLFVQNIRVTQNGGGRLENVILAEAAGRLPFPSNEAEVRHIEAGDVRQGDAVRREVIVLACHRPTVTRILDIAETAGLTPVAIEPEPLALLRCYRHQFRRDDDNQRRVMFVHVGASGSVAAIAQGADVMFVKYIDVGGRQLDESVAHNLHMSLGDASALRRHNGDRRADQRDPEITRSIHEATRPVFDRLAEELSLCLRYYSVTFRGQPLSRIVLGGGEAAPSLAEWLGRRLDLNCELGNPLRAYDKGVPGGRVSQWDVVAGLALRETE